MKRKSDNDEAEQRRQDAADEVEATINGLDEAGSLTYLDDLRARWQLDAPPQTFEHGIALVFHNFGEDMLGTIDASQPGSFGIRRVEEAINRQEMEAIALYYRLKVLNQLEEPEVLARVTAVLEQISHGKGLVLRAFQSQVAYAKNSYDTALDADLDAKLGSWSLRFRWIGEGLNEAQKLILHMCDVAMQCNYRKHGDSVFEPIVIDGHDTHAWKYVCEIKEFVYRECRKEVQLDAWMNLTSGATVGKTVLEYLSQCNDFQFPMLHKNRTVWAFRNGVYLGREDRFHEFATATRPLPSNIVASKFFDLDFFAHEGIAWQQIDTPHFQGILNFQEYSPEVAQWMYILIGRLMYDVGERDGWQTIPFMKGQAGSGKCFAAGTRVMLHDATSKPVEEVRLGDTLMGDDGGPREVVSLAAGTAELFRVEGVRGHSTQAAPAFDVTGEHVLCLRRDGELAELTVEEYLRLPACARSALTVYKVFPWPRAGTVKEYAFTVRSLPGAQTYHGFQIAGPNERFLLEDYTVTHNSTIIKVCQDIYDVVDVATLSNNIEKTFGIESLHGKYIFVAPEIKADLRIEQADFQSIVSGERVQVARKHKTAVGVQWTTPGILAGNEVPSWADNSGSIQRRVCVFGFDKPVTHGDMKLAEKLEKEMATLLVKFNRAYLETARAHGSKNVWSVLPQYFKHTRNEMAADVNSVEAFLGSQDVVLDPEKFMPFDDFKLALKTFEHQNQYKSARYTADFFRGPFAKYNLQKVRDSMTYRGRKMKRDYVMGVDLLATDDADNALG